MFSREDWELLRELPGVCQRAGVTLDRLAPLLVKELVDNAIDASGACEFGELDDRGFYVEDRGPGIDGGREAVARIFSIGRPLTTSKLIRLPTRGRLGHGTRLVAGAVLASSGSLRVATHGVLYELAPQDDGTTTVVSESPHECTGTRVEIRVGPGIPLNMNLFDWAGVAQELAAQLPAIRTSAHWYESDAFFALCRASGPRSARELVAMFEGCSGKAGKIAEPFRGRTAAELSRAEADELLGRARRESKTVRPERLGFVGSRVDLGEGYARHVGQFTVRASNGEYDGLVPYVVEAWAGPHHFDGFRLTVNRSPVPNPIQTMKAGNEILVGGVGVPLKFTVGRGHWKILINIQTPHLALTSDGKGPDLSGLANEIMRTGEKALRAARRRVGPASRRTGSQRERIVDALPEAVAKAGGEGQFRYSLRQLYYAARPLVALTGEPLDYNYFAQVVTGHESLAGEDLPGIYRDARGTLYHPHAGDEISLGTLAVEDYEVPELLFNKILYAEKEGIVSILRQNGFPERHDCALLSSKGFASRAARDVLDRMGDSSEDLMFFCIHDADAEGTKIHEALQSATRARPERRVVVVNLGLDPWEAVEMGLPIERVQRRKVAPTAAYVPTEWKNWLQDNRIELNAMTTPELIAWLDRKMIDHGSGKVIPDSAAIEDRLRRSLRERLKTTLTEEIIRTGKLDERIDAGMAALEEAASDRAIELPAELATVFETDPERSWSGIVGDAAGALVDTWMRSGRTQTRKQGRK